MKAAAEVVVILVRRADIGGPAVDADLGQEVRRLAAMQPDYLLLGHSHARRDERIGATRYINAGALHRARPWTVALLDLAKDEVQTLVIEPSS